MKVVVKNLFPDALFAALGPALGFVGYGVASKRSKGMLVPALAAGLATVAGGFLASFLQQKISGSVAGFGALPDIYMRERPRLDSGMPRYPSPQQMPGGYKGSTGSPVAGGNSSRHSHGPKDRVAALQLEAIRGACGSCW